MNDLFDSDSNDLFPPADRAKIEALTEDPDARVSHELTKGFQCSAAAMMTVRGRRAGDREGGGFNKGRRRAACLREDLCK